MSVATDQQTPLTAEQLEIEYDEMIYALSTAEKQIAMAAKQYAIDVVQMVQRHMLDEMGCISQKNLVLASSWLKSVIGTLQFLEAIDAQ